MQMLETIMKAIQQASESRRLSSASHCYPDHDTVCRSPQRWRKLSTLRWRL